MPRITNEQLKDLLQKNPFLARRVSYPLDEKQQVADKAQGDCESQKTESHAPDRTRYAILINCIVGDNRRRDGDGIINTLFDSLQHAGIIPDDSIENIGIIVAMFERGKEWDTTITLCPYPSNECCAKEA